MTNCLLPMATILLLRLAVDIYYKLKAEEFGKVCELEKCAHNLPTQKTAYACYTSESTILI